MGRELMKLVRDLLRQFLRSERRRRNAPVLIAVLTIAVFAISQWLYEPNAPLPAGGAEMTCRVSGVSDGDTITASCDTGKLNVRVYGIDAPEMGQKPWGNTSRDLLRGLLPSTVLLRVVDTDRYGRVVAQIVAGNQDVGLEMVRQGGAAVYAQYNESPEYRQAEVEARRDKRGIWSRNGSQQEPWEWRKLNPR